MESIALKSHLIQIFNSNEFKRVVDPIRVRKIGTLEVISERRGIIMNMILILEF